MPFVMPARRAAVPDKRAAVARPFALLLALSFTPAFALICAPAALRAQEAAAPATADCPESERPPVARVVPARRALGEIRIDGVLEEPDWLAPAGPTLVQLEPRRGCTPTQRTDWWVAYDDEALYVAARLWDDAADSIASRLGRRDTGPASDWLYLNLDTFNDDRTGYSFSVNPAGVIGDSYLYNEGASDPTWDPVWERAARTDGQGWSVEIRIPFSQINFPDREEQVWGINVSRRLLRRQGRDDLAYRERDAAGYNRHFPDLVGIAGIRPSNRGEALVYAAGRTEHLQTAADDPFNDGSRQRGQAGADLRWNLSNQLTLNGSANPDFGQVEVDPAVVNLSDYETFYEERRPFFVEKANIFRYGREGTNNNWNMNWSEPMPFYSRRIGRAPQLGLNGNDYADAPPATTILGAAKLSGMAGPTEIGFVGAVTDREQARLALGETRESQTVEPRTLYSVLRLRRPSADGSRALGAMLTGVRRDLDGDAARAALSREAWTAGLDGWLGLGGERSWALRGYLSASRIAGDAAAIAAQQRSSRRYYQRPEAHHLTYDPTRTSLSGWAGRVMLNKERGSVRVNSSLGAISPGYEVNDLGYATRADQVNWHLALGYDWNEPTRTFRSRSIAAATFANWDFGGHPADRGFYSYAAGQFANYVYAQVSVDLNPARFSHRATRGGPVARLPAYHGFGLYASGDSRRSLQWELDSSVWRTDDGSAGYHLAPSLTYQPRGALKVSVGPNLDWTHDLTQWVGRVDDPTMTATYGVRHLFGDMDYRELGLTTRVDWTFSPALTLQSFVQPLLAAGDFRQLVEFARPGTFDFDRYGIDNGSTVAYDAAQRLYTIDPDGPGPAAPFTLPDPDFSFKSLKVNVVLRWEYRPGSTAYLAWTHNRANAGHPGDFRAGRDLRALLDTAGDNVVMLKITNWFQL